MYLLIQLSDVRDLLETVIRKQEPDTPLESIQYNQKFFDDLSEMLDLYLNPDDPDAVQTLLEDEEILEKVAKLVKFIVECVILREAIRWFKIIDHTGGLAISIKPGEDPCLLRPTLARLPVSLSTHPAFCKTITPA